MRREVLERVEPRPERAHVRDRQRRAFEVERRHRLDEGEVAGGPRPWAGEVAREEPVRGPLADTAQRDEPSLDLLVVQHAQRRVVDVRAREADDVLRLAPREAERQELLRLGGAMPSRVGKE